jgi:hypothetical protein
VKFLFVCCYVAGLFCSHANAQKSAPSNAALDKSKIAVRNNASSLLADLLGNEKNLSTILIIKHNFAEFGRLIKAISKTAGDGTEQLESLAKNDTTLNLHALQLPPGEIAARAAMSKTMEHELLFSSGEKFELHMLLTRTDSLDYGSHLAKIAAENSSSPEQERKFHSLNLALNALFQQVVAKLRAVPGQITLHSPGSPLQHVALQQIPRFFTVIASFPVRVNRATITTMSLVQVVVVLIVVGVVLWLINRFIPMQGTIKSILNAVVVIVVVLWLLNVFGLTHYLYQFHVPHPSN